MFTKEKLFSRYALLLRTRKTFQNLENISKQRGMAKYDIACGWVRASVRRAVGDRVKRQAGRIPSKVAQNRLGNN